MHAMILAFESPGDFNRRHDKAAFKAYMDGWYAYGGSLEQAERPAEALAALDAIEASRIATHQPYWATRAHALTGLDRGAEASAAFERAIGLSRDPAARAFLRERMRR